MDKTLKKRVLEIFDLENTNSNSGQRQAVLERERDIVVTAGAGSGKTRTLVARYMSLLADGYDLRRITAITFTEKAAREMRSRVRATLEALLRGSGSDVERTQLREWQGQMDAAKISTIHSLCAEILRTHPAEAGVDPKFEVLDEGLAAVLRAQSIKDAMLMMAEEAAFAPLFQQMDTRALETVLGTLLDRRLQTEETLERHANPECAVTQTVQRMMEAPDLVDGIVDLREARSADLMADCGDRLAAQIFEMLELWTEGEEALARGELGVCSAALFLARREKMKLNIGKRSSSYKEVLRAFRDLYDAILQPIFGGKSTTNEPPDEATEREFREILPQVKEAFELVKRRYTNALARQSALDFDDLEGRAADLLQEPDIQQKWRSEVDALLVDEFQDTNQRQRDIVEALTGQNGKLFIVGDAKQSIYRFRQADVAVFRAIRENIQAQGGLPIQLATTYRAHTGLLVGMNDLLRSVMGEKEDPDRLYYEPFAAMRATREVSAANIQPPYIEFVIGRGANAADGRPDAARALAQRLRELKDVEQIKEWSDTALLFRTANAFRYYEDMFEAADIPFVTVAGKGFYERAEIRDVLNMLYALSDPMDDLAMAGFLRSPAIGLRDTTLYTMRWKSGEGVHFWDSLREKLDLLGTEERARADRAHRILRELLPLVDRTSVAVLLKHLIDLTDYRAILAIEEGQGGARLWRNLDKLVDDARASGKTNVRDFLEYLEAINTTGVREGEAPAEAQGAVRLMTIHKAKGLQFPIVVLADAGRRLRNSNEAVYLDHVVGLAFKLEKEPLAYRLAKLQDQAQTEAEEARILYVALTRAQEKIIISGHVSGEEEKGWHADGWLELLSGMAGVDICGVVENVGEVRVSQTYSGAAVRAWAMESGTPLAQAVNETETEPKNDSSQQPLFAPLEVEITREIRSDQEDERYRQPVTGSLEEMQGKVIGWMVHRAIAMWMFPGDDGLETLLHTTAMQAGLAELQQRERAVEKATMLLAKLKTHDLYQEIETASERYHELPYSRIVKGTARTGYIDLLYRNESGWHVVDFKTDTIHSQTQREEKSVDYCPQVKRYIDAVEQSLDGAVSGAICFMDDRGDVSLEEI